jgi:hypothetical protein
VGQAVPPYNCPVGFKESMPESVELIAILPMVMMGFDVMHFNVLMHS